MDQSRTLAFGVALRFQHTRFLPYGASDPTTESPKAFHRMAASRRHWAVREARNGGHRWVVRRLTRFLRNQQTKDKTTHMKPDTVIMSVLIALVVSIAQGAPDSPTLPHT